MWVFDGNGFTMACLAVWIRNVAVGSLPQWRGGQERWMRRHPTAPVNVARISVATSGTDFSAPEAVSRRSSGLLASVLWETTTCFDLRSLCDFHPCFGHGNYGFAILRNRSSLQQCRTLINVALAFFDRFFWHHVH